MLRKSKFWQRHFNTNTLHFQQICIDEASQQVCLPSLVLTLICSFVLTYFNILFLKLRGACVQEYVKEINVLKPVRDLRLELQKAASSEDVSYAGQLADLMLKCLCHDPAKRFTPEQALAHPFLKP